MGTYILKEMTEFENSISDIFVCIACIHINILITYLLSPCLYESVATWVCWNSSLGVCVCVYGQTVTGTAESKSKKKRGLLCSWRTEWDQDRRGRGFSREAGERKKRRRRRVGCSFREREKEREERLGLEVSRVLVFVTVGLSQREL